MPRVKTGTTTKSTHKRILKLAKGFRMARHRLYTVAKDAVLHAGAYAYNGRKEKKQQFRKLWIIRINAALKTQEKPVSYSQFIHSINEKGIKLNRKVLSEIAIKLPNIFSEIFTFTR